MRFTEIAVMGVVLMTFALVDRVVNPSLPTMAARELLVVGLALMLVSWSLRKLSQRLRRWLSARRRANTEIKLSTPRQRTCKEVNDA